MTAVAECDHVGRTYRTGRDIVAALTDLTVAVPADARWALTGPSGSGKSTVLHLLAGLDTPTVGVGDLARARRPPARLARAASAMVFQGPSLMPHLTAEENVAFPLQVAGCAAADVARRAHAALERLGLSDLARTLPAQMSGGQAQRVAIARVLASASPVDPRRRADRSARPRHRTARARRAARCRRRHRCSADRVHPRPGCRRPPRRSSGRCADGRLQHGQQSAPIAGGLR